MRHISKSRVQVASLHYLLDKPEDTLAANWVSELRHRAYDGAQENKKIKVLINPFGGKGLAQTLYSREIEPIFAAAKCEIDVERTLHRGHAAEIAERLNLSAYDVVACCSGDGTPHEVFNGLGRRSDAVNALSEIAVVQLPCGTGNAMSLNLNGTDSPSLAALAILKGSRAPLDLTSITQGGKRTLSFLSQAVGIVAEVDLGTEHLRWMGSARFTYGFFVRIMRKTVYPCDLAVNFDVTSKAEIKDLYRRHVSEQNSIMDASMDRQSPSDGLPPLQFGAVEADLPSSFAAVPAKKIGNFYAGNMALMAPGANFFPASLPSDGHLDLINIDGEIGRLAAIQCFLAVENGKFFDNKHVKYSKIGGYRINPLYKGEGYIAIDGERVPFEAFQAEVHKGLGRTLSRSVGRYEAEGVASPSMSAG